MVQRLRLCPLMQEVWVQSLVRELRSHISHGQKTKSIKQEQYCNKFNKAFENGSYVISLKKKLIEK